MANGTDRITEIRNRITKGRNAVATNRANLQKDMQAARSNGTMQTNGNGVVPLANIRARVQSIRTGTAADTNGQATVMDTFFQRVDTLRQRNASQQTMRGGTQTFVRRRGGGGGGGGTLPSRPTSAQQPILGSMQSRPRRGQKMVLS